MMHGSLTLEAPWIAVGTGPMSFISCLPTPSYCENPSSGNMFHFVPITRKKEKAWVVKVPKKRTWTLIKGEKSESWLERHPALQ